VLEQSRAGIGSSDVVMLMEPSADATLSEARDGTCTCLEAIGGHDVMFQRLVVWVFPLTVDMSVAASCMAVGVVQATKDILQPGAHKFPKNVCATSKL